MKQTAVEWLHEQIEQYILTHGNLPFNVLSKFKKQAIEMEQKMVIDIVEKSRATGLTAEYLLLTYENK